jgi:antitoxin (DNA-binding transcriptional repressor) of toxin-antitoxin stability system
MKIAIADFKARCLGLLEDLYQNDGQILLTKRGKIIAQIEPYREDDAVSKVLEGVQMRPDWR